jgi:hypothetical protein
MMVAVVMVPTWFVPVVRHETPAGLMMVKAVIQSVLMVLPQLPHVNITNEKTGTNTEFLPNRGPSREGGIETMTELDRKTSQ